MIKNNIAAAVFYLFCLFLSVPCLTQVPFSEPILIQQTSTPRPFIIISADLDNDGDMDVLSASSMPGEYKITWCENIDGKGTFGHQKIITTSVIGPNSIFTADLDKDGDFDVLSASSGDNKIAWYENTDGHGTFGPQQIISTNANWASSVCSADLDGDGDLDVLSASSGDNKITWYENTDGAGTFVQVQAITTLAFSATSVYASDMDNDGDIDVLSASNKDDKIAWYENTDGAGFFILDQNQIITTFADGAMSVYASDLDSDGDIDVLSASQLDNKIAWYENVDGSGNFSPQKIITTSANGARSVIASDLDDDGDLDVLSSSLEDDKIAWYNNIDGKGTFGTQQIITTQADGATSVYTADLDGDGNIDILSSSFWDDKIAWYKNMDNHGSFSLPIIISGSAEPISINTADFDKDGDVDVLSSCFDNKVIWHENLDGLGNYSPMKIISTQANGGAYSVCSIDVDGDEDIDVLSASMWDNKIAWYENTDSKGNFGPQHTISSSAVGAYSVYSADIDGDRDMDALSASWSDDKIAWYENLDGKGTFSSQKIITYSADGAYSVFSVDIDGDGDMDILSASSEDDKIAWYENTDGSGNFGPQQIIANAANKAHSVYASDIDGDGDMDVLSASSAHDNVVWYENTGGKECFSTNQNHVITTLANGAMCVYASDLDDDGDQDVLSASGYTIAWYENMDGMGTFEPQQILITKAFGATSVCAADVDGDKDMDVLSAWSLDKKTVWQRNSMPPIANFGADHLSIEAQLSVEFHDSSRGGRTSWQWDFGDGETSNEENPTHTYLTADSFTVTLKVEGPNGSDTKIKKNYIIVTMPSSIRNTENSIPLQFILNQNYPNPFNPSTQIEYNVKETCQVYLAIYNLNGKILNVLVDSKQQPGKYMIRFDTQDVPSGIYFCMIIMGDFHDVKKLVKVQ